MIFASIDWLSISINLLLVVFVIVCLLMALLILMQRPKQEGLGAAFGGGVTDQVFGARTTNVLQKGTVYLGSLFFILSLTLAILIGKQTKHKSLMDPVKPVAEEKAKAEESIVEEAPGAPKSLAEELPVNEIEAPVAVDPAPAEEVAPAVESAPAEEVAPEDSGEISEPAAETPVPSEPGEDNADKSE